MQFASTDALHAGKSLTVTPGAGGTCIVTLTRGPFTESQTISTATTFGPYNVDLNFSVIALGWSASYVIQEATLQLRIGM